MKNSSILIGKNMIYDNVLSMIGGTPLLKLTIKNGWELYLKMEMNNPGRSMKDRMALNMVADAEKDGRLKPGGTIVESSSGNTAIGLVIVSAVKGYKFIAVVDHHAAKEKIGAIKAYGGKIVYVKGKYAKNEVAVAERERLADEISKKIPGSFFPAQADNFSNRASYIDTMAKEILDDLPDFDYLIGSIGTGGSLCGTAIGIKKRNKKVKVVAVEPAGSIIFGGKGGLYFQSGTGNPDGADIPKIIDFNLIDENYYATDQEAFDTCCFLAKHKGIMVGGSAGGVLFNAVKLASRKAGPGKIVVIIPDGGEKYINTIYNARWIKRNQLSKSENIRFLKEYIC